MGKRVDIKTGFSCNNNCLFCVQAHKKHLGDRTTGEIKKDIKEARKTCEDIVFTGGEVTIRKDILELVSYAKKLGYKTIQIQTNARMLSYLDFCKKLIRAGANEFSPAIHGPNAKIHDSLTRAHGSFEQTVKGIKNLKSLNQKVITNTVVVKQNYKKLPEIAKLLVKLDVDQFQFAFVHPIGNAMKYCNDVVPKMSRAAPYIKKGLQVGIGAGVKVMAEAMPYCMMKGYEHYVSENFIPETEIIDFDYCIEDYKKARILQGKTKFRQCLKCRYNGICEGPWKEYPEKFGNKEFKAVKKTPAEIIDRLSSLKLKKADSAVIGQLAKLGRENWAGSDDIIYATYRHLLEKKGTTKVFIKRILLDIYPLVELDKGAIGTCLCFGGWGNFRGTVLENLVADERLNIHTEGKSFPFNNHPFFLSLYDCLLSAMSVNEIENEKELFDKIYTKNNKDYLDVIKQDDLVVKIGFASYHVDYRILKNKIIGFDNHLDDPIRAKQIEKDIKKIKGKNPDIEIEIKPSIDAQILRNADVVFISGSTICNGSLYGILKDCKKAREVILIGRSALIYPSQLFRLGVTRIISSIPPKNLFDLAVTNYPKYFKLDEPGEQLILRKKNGCN
jgi:MoaA/NifB/PqqE/SkfB family radical SAM enzyme